MEELFDDAELALLRSTKPIALQVHPNWAMSIVEARPGLVAAVVGGPQVDTITGGQGVVFWLNPVEQHRYGLNVMATLLHLHAATQVSAREAPLLYGPVFVAL